MKLRWDEVVAIMLFGCLCLMVVVSLFPPLVGGALDTARGRRIMTAQVRDILEQLAIATCGSVLAAGLLVLGFWWFLRGHA